MHPNLLALCEMEGCNGMAEGRYDNILARANKVADLMPFKEMGSLSRFGTFYY